MLSHPGVNSVAGKRQKLIFPGDRLRRLLGDNQISQEVFADWIGVSRLTVNQIINHRRSITAEVALRIAKATSTHPDDWLVLQQQVDLRDAERRVGREVSRLLPLIKPPRKAKRIGVT